MLLHDLISKANTLNFYPNANLIKLSICTSLFHTSVTLGAIIKTFELSFDNLLISLGLKTNKQQNKGVSSLF